MSAKKTDSMNEMGKSLALRQRVKRLHEKTRKKRQPQRAKDYAEIFPQLSAEQIDALSNGVLKKRDEIGYQLGSGTEAYWDTLGYRVTGNPDGHIVDGDTLVPVYEYYSVREKCSRLSARKRWKRLCAQVGPTIALVETLVVIDRLQKVQFLEEVENQIDLWLRLNRKNLVEARFIFEDIDSCGHCEGTGFDDEEDDVCSHCDATGETEPRSFWEHHVNIEGRIYHFHSFEQPDEDCDVVNESKREQPATNCNEPFESEQLPIPSRRLLIDMVKIGLAEQVAAVRERIVANAQKRIAARTAS